MISDDLKTSLKSLVDHFDQEDRSVRDRQIRMWRRLKLYWDGFQRVWWSEVAHDWRIYDPQDTESNAQSGYYDKPVNIFRAYLESIIAALSVNVPPVRCFPDDADDPLDLMTAKAGNRIAELVYKHNDVSLLWLHALYIYCTEGLIACYNYTDENEKYGTYETNETELVEEEGYFCPECEEKLDPVTSMTGQCPECGFQFTEPIESTVKEVEKITGTKEHPKSRQLLKVYGGLWVKVPNYARSQEQCPYLMCSEEVHYAIAMAEYPDLQEVDPNIINTGYSSGGLYDPYERWGRLNPQYYGEYPNNTVTIRKIWLRPSSYNILSEDSREELKREFPNGVRVDLVNDEIACDPKDELLDDHWTLTRNPLSDYLHHDPIGMLLTSIQDITNELVSLTLQTVEHGIPQTFADPRVLDFNAYRQSEVAPGSIFPARPRAGLQIGHSFYEVKTATLSREVMPFGEQIQSFGQLVVGALPSLFGGASKAGSNTAAEYSMSRAQALQRLQTPWKMLGIWWKEVFAKVIPAYIDSVVEDQRFVTEDDAGNFVNIFIRRSELQGKIGDVECAANEQLPTTWDQLKDTIIQLMELNNPAILAALSSPENLPFIAEAIGLNQFKIPGEADRQKQYEEIGLLIQSGPIPREIPTPDGGMTEEEGPSVPIDPDVDNHMVHAEICKVWAVSEAGKTIKEENPEGYKNVLLHLKMHQLAVQSMQGAQQQEQEQGPPA